MTYRLTTYGLEILPRPTWVDAGVHGIRRPGSHDPTDVTGCLRHGLVLPDADDRPSERLQMDVGLTVPLHVARELGRPPGGVVGGCCLVFGAPVPEAAIDEDSDLRTGEQDVSAASRHARQRVVDAVPKPESVEFAAEEQLGFGVPRRLLGHPRGSGGEHIGERCYRRGAGARCGVGAR